MYQSEKKKKHNYNQKWFNQGKQNETQDEDTHAYHARVCKELLHYVLQNMTSVFSKSKYPFINKLFFHQSLVRSPFAVHWNLIVAAKVQSCQMHLNDYLLTMLLEFLHEVETHKRNSISIHSNGIIFYISCRLLRD